MYHSLLRSAGRFDIPETVPTTELLAYLSRRSATILDVGANVGRYSRFFSRHVATDARVFAFEPGTSAYSLCLSNTNRNDNIVCHNIALGDTDKTEYLHIPTDDGNNPVSALGWTGGEQASGSEIVQEIKTRSLDALAGDAEIEIRAPLFIKIDVEGAELAVLKGAAKSIKQFQPVLYFECELSHLKRNRTVWQEIWDFLVSHEYLILSEENGLFLLREELSPDCSNYFSFPATAEFPRKEHYTFDEIARVYTHDG